MLGRTLTIPGAMMTPSVSRPPEGLRSGTRSPTTPPVTAMALVVISIPDAFSRAVTCWSALTSSAGSRCRSVIGWPAPMPTRSLRPIASSGVSSLSAGASPAIRPETRSSATIRLPLVRGRAARSVGAVPGAVRPSPDPLRKGGAIAAAAPVRRMRTQGCGALQRNSTTLQFPPRGPTCGGCAQPGRSRSGAAICGAGSPTAAIASRTSETAVSPLIPPAGRGRGASKAPTPIPKDKSHGRRTITTVVPPYPETGSGVRQRRKGGGPGPAARLWRCARTV